MDRDFVFAIDCDEVLRKTLDAMVKVYNEHFKANLTRDDVKSFVCEESFPEIEESTGVTASHWFFQEHGTEMFLETEPYPNIKEDINTLRKYGKVVIVTYQKSYQNKLDTLMWLERQGIECDGICFLKQKGLVNADYLIDDNDWNFRLSGVKHAIVVNAPYNLDVPDKQIKNSSAFIRTVDRVENLHEFVTKFEQAENDLIWVRNNYMMGVGYTLRSPVPYKDSSIYHKERNFGQAGDKVEISNTFISGMKAYVNLNLVNSWGGITVEAKKLVEYL